MTRAPGGQYDLVLVVVAVAGRALGPSAGVGMLGGHRRRVVRAIPHATSVNLRRRGHGHLLERCASLGAGLGGQSKEAAHGGAPGRGGGPSQCSRSSLSLLAVVRACRQFQASISAAVALHDAPVDPRPAAPRLRPPRQQSRGEATGVSSLPAGHTHAHAHARSAKPHAPNAVSADQSPNAPATWSAKQAPRFVQPARAQR